MKSLRRKRLDQHRRILGMIEDARIELGRLLRDAEQIRAAGRKALVVNDRLIVIGRSCYRRFRPWEESLAVILRRCSDGAPEKERRLYFDRGIRCRITAFELEEMWFRDKAYLMRKPSVCRINRLDDYRFENCRYVEASESSRKPKCSRSG